MKSLPKTENTLVLRTDFSDDAAWEGLCARIREPGGEFKAYVDFVSDPEFAELDAAQLPALCPDKPHRSFAFIVDRTALSQLGHPILVLDLVHQPGRTFRVVPSELWSVENNLSISNMDFEEFLEAVEKDGVFRGFPATPAARPPNATRIRPPRTRLPTWGRRLDWYLAVLAPIALLVAFLLQPDRSIEWAAFEPRIGDAFSRGNFHLRELRTYHADEVQLPMMVQWHPRYWWPTPSRHGGVAGGRGPQSLVKVFGVTRDQSTMIDCCVRILDDRAVVIEIHARSVAAADASVLRVALVKEFPSFPIRLSLR